MAADRTCDHAVARWMAGQVEPVLYVDVIRALSLVGAPDELLVG
jgi:hypothetical protein